MSHIEVGIWLGGVYDYISDAREKLVATGKMTERDFKNVFSIGRIAKRIVTATAAADSDPRGSQGRSHENTSAPEIASLPIPASYMRLSREKQLNLIRFCRETRDRETAEQSLIRKYEKELRAFESSASVLRSRVDAIGFDFPSDENEDEAHVIWNDVRETETTIRSRREEIPQDDKTYPRTRNNNVISNLQRLQSEMRQYWRTFDFMKSINRRLSGVDEVRDVIPETASQVPDTSKRRRNYLGKAPELIKDKSVAADRAVNMVSRQLDKWVRLGSIDSTPVAEPLNESDDKFIDINRQMVRLASDLDAFFKDNPLDIRVCCAAFSAKRQSQTTVYVEGALPENYRNNVRTLLEKLVGAGYKRKREINRRTTREHREYKKAQIKRYTK